jgi:hypothetical protein
MADLVKVADLLQKLTADRQVLAIGQSDAAITQGQSGLFSTNAGNISAIATNFCYGNCLLAKVDGAWYAINPSDNRDVVRQSIERLSKSKSHQSSQVNILNLYLGIAYGLDQTIYVNAGDNIQTIAQDEGKLFGVVFVFDDDLSIETDIYPQFYIVGSAIAGVHYELLRLPPDYNPPPANNGGFSLPAGDYFHQFYIKPINGEQRLLAPVRIEIGMYDNERDYNYDNGANYVIGTITPRTPRKLVKAQDYSPGSVPPACDSISNYHLDSSTIQKVIYWGSVELLYGYSKYIWNTFENDTDDPNIVDRVERFQYAADTPVQDSFYIPGAGYYVYGSTPGLNGEANTQGITLTAAIARFGPVLLPPAVQSRRTCYYTED